MIKIIAISTYLIALALFSLSSIFTSFIVDPATTVLLEVYVDFVLIIGGILYLRGVKRPKWLLLAAPAIVIQAYMAVTDGCSYINIAIWLIFLSPLFFFSYRVAFGKCLDEKIGVAEEKEKTKSKFSVLAAYFLIPIFILIVIASVYLYAGGGRYYFYLPFASKIAFKNEAYELAESYANEMLQIAKNGNNDWNKGNAIFSGNIVLGRLALKKGKTKEASEYLIKAGKTPGSPQLNSFGPGMGLAKDLLEKGETEAVIKYLELCKVFWELENDQIDQWIILIQNGKAPNFSMNSNYY